MHLKKLSFLAVLLLSLGLTGCGSDNLDTVSSDNSDGSGDTSDNMSDNSDDTIYTASGNFTPKIIQRGQTFTFNYYLDKTPDAAVIYDIDIVGTAIQGTSEDYTISNASTLTFAKGSTTTNLTITTYQKEDVYDARTLSLTFTGNTGEPATINLLISGNVYLNDTGITHYSDGSSFDIQTQTNDKYKQQDAAYGLDIIINSAATEPDTGDSKDDTKQLYKNAFDVNPSDSEYKGKAGFRFVKMHDNGMALSASSTNHSCVKDEVTGLIWQVKSTYNTLSNVELDPTLPANYQMADARRYQASNFSYPWKASALSGVGPGWQNGRVNNGAFIPEDNLLANRNCGYNSGFTGRDFDLYCSSGSYANETNFLKICGQSNWVVPTVEQLRSIINYEKVTDYADLVANKHGLDETFFDCPPGDCVIANNSLQDPLYWTSSSVKGAEGLAWCINLENGAVQTCNKREYHKVLVVSSNVPAEFFNPNSDNSTVTD
ncbi:Lcl C-terminal domain-containing protein [Moritella yayanosii]|uniref:Lcl C-terminal domain-containing protein n=1 Tax=Moritella yayanosii TaxID=69539 RepID=A0A330LUW4_9GAMM|nr:DUF1566 domain-containing protein [Moritella yayanosii]SQD79811.1 conserved exported protein of unknown function [Moritella yayanosii]